MTVAELATCGSCCTTSTVLRFSLGQDIHIELRQFVTGSRRPTRSTLRVSSPNNQVPGVDAPCIDIGDRDAARGPAACYESPYGAVATLTFPNGTTLAHVLHRVRVRVRAPVEHVFGTIRSQLGGLEVRAIGLTRVRCWVGLKNLLDNMHRFIQLERSAPAMP